MRRITFSLSSLLLAIALLTGGGLFYLAKLKPLLPPFESVIKGWDDSFYYFWLRSPMIDGDVDFSNDLVYCDTMPAEQKERALKRLNRHLTDNGFIPNKYGIGWAVSELPWFLAGDLGTRIMKTFYPSLLLDGYGPIYQLMLMIGQLAYAIGSLFFSLRILRHFFDDRTSLESMLFVWLGSIMLAYQTVFLTMAHNITFFMLTGTYCFTMQIRSAPDRILPWLAAGIFSGLLVISRYQAVVYLIYPAATISIMLMKRRNLFPRVCLYIVSLCLMIAPQLIAWKALYGQYLLYTYKGEGFSWLSPHILEVFFSPFHGLFYWHPIYFIALFGFFVWVWKTRNIEALCWLFALIAMTYVNASWNGWSAGASFGARFFEGITLFAMIGIAFLLLTIHKMGRHARLLFVFALFCLVAWNINLLVIFLKGAIATEAPVTYAEMLRGTLDFWLHI